LAKASEDYGEAVALLHDEIKKLGGTPVEDASVPLKPDADSESTATPVDNDSCNEEADSSPEKGSKHKLPEESEADRAQAEAQEAEEQARQEKKAEEQRKKKEQKKREAEKRDAAVRKAEAAQRAKDRKAQEKASAREAEKVSEKIASPDVKSTLNDTGIDRNVILVVLEAGIVFASMQSSDEVSTIAEGSFLVASGPPAEVDGYDMVPLQPCGAVELRIVKQMPLPAAQAVSDVITQGAAAPDETVPQEETIAPVKKAVKPGKDQQEEEDLDNLLSEFGVVLQPVTKSAKRRGKK